MEVPHEEQDDKTHRFKFNEGTPDFKVQAGVAQTSTVPDDGQDLVDICALGRYGL
jgi:hypothetical protein